MNHKSDRNELKFTQNYQSNSVPETMLLTEAEDSMLSTEGSEESKTSERVVIFGLGIISTLLFFSGIQLQRSVNIVPNKIEHSPTVRRFKKVLNTSPTELSQQQDRRLDFTDKLDFAHKNSISQGRF